MKKKFEVILWAILILSALIVMTTYSYWIVNKSQTDTNIVESKCMELSLTEQENDITLLNAWPLTDEEGMALTPFTFKVTNTCNKSQDYILSLETISELAGNIDLSAIKVQFDSDEPIVLNSLNSIEKTLDNTTDARFLYLGTVAANSSNSHSLRIWIDQHASISNASVVDSTTGDVNHKSYEGKITLSYGQDVINPFKDGTLAMSIINNYINGKYSYQEKDHGEVYTVDKMSDIRECNFQYASSNTHNNGLFKITDSNYYSGNSAYFLRGNVTDNYVKFAGYYWRIMRINSDGTIRVVFDGVGNQQGNGYSNGTAHAANIGSSTYLTSMGKIPEYTSFKGYKSMDVKVAIIDILNNWYENNIVAKKYTHSVANTGFCIDNSMREEGDHTEYYANYDRIKDNQTELDITCQDPGSDYTEKNNDIYSITNLSAKLKYPISIMTVEDLVMAGNKVHGQKNLTQYLYNGESSWTASGSMVKYSKLTMYSFTNEGILADDTSVDANLNIRPVLNLRADVEFTGNGTATNPYVIK